MPQPTRSCTHCGEDFEVPARDRNPKKYCSRSCQARASRARNPPPPKVKDPGEYVVNTGTCTECGTQTRSKPGAGRAPQTCSDECARQRRSRLAKQRYREQVTTGETIRGHHHEKTCEMCGDTFTARASARFCSHTCRDLNNLATGQLARMSEAHRIDPLESKRIRGSCAIQYGECPQCNRSWMGRTGTGRRYCSERCADRAWSAARQLLERRTTCQVTYLDCPECASPFTADPTWGKVFCSVKCRDRAARRRYPRPSKDSPWLAHRDFVFDRDGMTCWLCGDQTSAFYAHEDPWSPTLDHVIPRHAGGPDTPDNLRVAHAICNSLKGHRDVASTTALLDRWRPAA